MNTNDQNQRHSTKGRRNSANAGAAPRLHAAMIALVLLSGAGLAAQEPTASPAKTPETHDVNALPNSLAVSDEQPVAEELMQRLWRTRLAVPKSDEEVQSNSDLTDLIQQVRSVKFEPKSPVVVPDVVARPPIENPPAEVPAAVQPSKEPTLKAVALAPVVSEEVLPTGTMEALRQLLADPNQVSDPAEMAELLFLSGRIREAAVFYRKALETVTHGEPNNKEDRAWILLQLGNCLRDTDLTQAQTMYTAVATEYPDSPWAELAKAQSQFLAWSETVRPRQWLPPAREQQVQGRPTAQAPRL